MTSSTFIDKKPRCAWVSQDRLYIDYHDQEWGVPIYEDRFLFEFLILEGMQAGLSWLTVLKKREHYRRECSNFQPEKIINYSQKKIQQLLLNPSLIRNRLKMNSIVTNAGAYLEVVEKSGSFSEFIWQFVDGKPIQNCWRFQTQVPTSTKISDAMSKELKERGFKFVGSTICYAFMQAVGMVNDHLMNCFRYNECKSIN